METRIAADFSSVVYWFLSYLWGMETISQAQNIHCLAQFLSYLWGMETIISLQQFLLLKSFLSYLWGMETTFDFCHILDNSRVLILPMRNGNEDSARRSAAGWVGVLILPMRNGNVLALTKYVPSSCSFLSYLWGMETICLISIINLFTWFLSYLWGMETILTNRRLMGDRQFLSYLWGMETHL